MMRLTKLLVLLAGVVAAACSGISPTAPNPTGASDEATAIAEAAVAKHPIADDLSDCRAITEVDLRLLRSDERQYAKIEAVYLKGGLPARCQGAPSWFSKPRNRVIETRDPFIVRVFRTPPTVVEVTAVAPNGVRGLIRVQ